MPVEVPRVIRRLLQLSALEWRYLAIALKELLLARIRHAARPIASSLREFEPRRDEHEISPDEAVDPRLVDIQRRAWAISVVAERVPWRSDCLLRSMAANRWLLRDHIKPEFFLGVAKDDAGNLQAHAWLKYRGIDVAGGERKEYSTFRTVQRSVGVESPVSSGVTDAERIPAPRTLQPGP